MLSAIAILLITLLFSFFSIRNWFILHTLDLWPTNLLQIWRPLTYTLVHSHWQHLIWNTIIYCCCFGFYQNFTNLEFLAFYFSSAIFSAIPFILRNKDVNWSNLCGNSGVVFSILFGWIALNPYDDFIFTGSNIPVCIIGSFFLIFTSIQWVFDVKVSASSHVFGAIFGTLWILILH